MTHDHLVRQRPADCEITLVMPFGIPIPPSPDTSTALVRAFSERGISFVPDRLVRSLDGARRVAVLDNGEEMPYDLFLGIPKHRVPDVVASSGMTVDGWVPVDTKTLRTEFENVYTVGDVNSVGTPKAGVFAEGTARTVAEQIIASVRGGVVTAYQGVGRVLHRVRRGTCRQSGSGVPGGPAHGDVHRAFGGAGERQDPLRLEPPRKVVWVLGIKTPRVFEAFLVC